MSMPSFSNFSGGYLIQGLPGWTYGTNAGITFTYPAYINSVPQAPPPPRPTANPYAVDPDARHLGAIKRALAAPWPPRSGT